MVSMCSHVMYAARDIDGLEHFQARRGAAHDVVCSGLSAANPLD
jgi:hypothetical protein